MRRRRLAFVPLGIVVGLALLSVQGVPAAQDATPAGEAAPITLEAWGSVPSTADPGMLLQLYRVTIAPGAVVPPTFTPGSSSLPSSRARRPTPSWTRKGNRVAVGSGHRPRLT